MVISCRPLPTLDLDKNEPFPFKIVESGVSSRFHASSNIDAEKSSKQISNSELAASRHCEITKATLAPKTAGEDEKVTPRGLCRARKLQYNAAEDQREAPVNLNKIGNIHPENIPELLEFCA
jgi:hypothetical protein